MFCRVVLFSCGSVVLVCKCNFQFPINFGDLEFSDCMRIKGLSPHMHCAVMIKKKFMEVEVWYLRRMVD